MDVPESSAEATASNVRRYVSVAIPVPLHQRFTYAVPADQPVAPGCRVKVRFGPHKKVGLVVEGPFDVPPDGYDPAKIRPVTAVLDPKPVVPPDLVSLSGWLASYYHAPPGDAYLLALPPQMGGGRSGTVKALKEREELVAKFVRSPDPTRGERIGRKMDAALSWLSTTEEATAKEVKQATGCDRGVLRRLEAGGFVTLDSRKVARDPFADLGPVAIVEPPTLTDEQHAAVATISESLGSYKGFLLQGVTGSGKTEVYLRLIAAVLERGQGALVLVPEIALTPQLVQRFRERMGDKIAVQHSGLDPAARHEQWLRIASGELPIVIGARSALFSPVVNLGLIVVDEEHEGSFKQDVSPRYHARDLALVRGHYLKAPVVLGSATPSLESWANVTRGKLTHVVMAKRATQRPMPTVEMVDLRTSPTVDDEGLFSATLLDAMRANLEAGNQTILFLNRRGFSAFVVCRTCGETLDCPRCAVSLTWHRGRHRLVCHYCDHTDHRPSHCPACNDDALQEFGIGTEQVVESLKTLLPSARVGRMDRDTTRGKALLRLLSDFRGRRLDVLVGTQMVAKGHDFPGVTLVGVLLAEQSLKLPDFRASERTFQLMTQIAGRAGRAELPGRVLVQTLTPSHYTLEAAQNHDTTGFLATELKRRHERSFPPWTALVLVRVEGPDLRLVNQTANGLVQMLQQARQALGPARSEVAVIGPKVAPLERLKDRHRWQILINAGDRGLARRMVGMLTHHLDATRMPRNVAIIVDVDPLSFL